MAETCMTQGLEVHGSHFKISMDVTFPNNTGISSSEKTYLVWCGMARDHTSQNGIRCHMMNSIKCIAYNQKVQEPVQETSTSFIERKKIKEERIL